MGKHKAASQARYAPQVGDHDPAETTTKPNARQEPRPNGLCHPNLHAPKAEAPQAKRHPPIPRAWTAMAGTGAPDKTATASKKETEPPESTMRTGTNHKGGDDATESAAETAKLADPTTPQWQIPRVQSSHAGVRGSSPPEEAIGELLP